MGLQNESNLPVAIFAYVTGSIGLPVRIVHNRICASEVVLHVFLVVLHRLPKNGPNLPVARSYSPICSH